MSSCATPLGAEIALDAGDAERGGGEEFYRRPFRVARMRTKRRFEYALTTCSKRGFF